MRSMLARRRSVRVAAMAACVALLAAACTKPPADPSPDPSGGGVLGDLTLAPDTLLVSNGAARVSIGDAVVTFPSTVTDAAWSPDGSRIAYVDGDGNIATARPDGTGVVVLTSADASVTRSRPSWSREWIFYAERKADGTSALMSVATNGCAILHHPAGGAKWPLSDADGTSYFGAAPSASLSVRPSRVAFQHDTPTGPEIWVDDTNQRRPWAYKVVDGSEPALSLDGQQLAYVGTDGQLYVTSITQETEPGVQVTAEVQQPSHLTWTADGEHVAYQTATGIESVETTTGAHTTTRLAEAPGVPSLLVMAKGAVYRLSGPDPIALSIAASQARWPAVDHFVTMQVYDGAYFATLTTPEDALRFPPGKHGGPLLLTSGDVLDERTRAELIRLFGDIDPDFGAPSISILGAQVSAAVEAELRQLGFQVGRYDEPSSRPTPAGGECGPQENASLFEQTLVVVDASVATDEALATWLASAWVGPILRIDGELSDEQRFYLARSSGSIEAIYVVDSGGAISTEVEQEIGNLVSGPAGFTTAENPVVPPLTVTLPQPVAG